jgi:hypothetical protein
MFVWCFLALQLQFLLLSVGQRPKPWLVVCCWLGEVCCTPLTWSSGVQSCCLVGYIHLLQDRCWFLWCGVPVSRSCK